jgi:UTP--glucose-1-phosphate uridylyltransferase
MTTEGVHAFTYQGRRYDCGSKQGFLEATVDFALKHPEVGPDFREYLKSVKA